MNIFKRRTFDRWQVAEGVLDCALCSAVSDMERGLIDASLGGCLYKQRIARVGGGKRGGYRTILSARIGSRYIFLYGFAKNTLTNITQSEKNALQFAGKKLLDLPGSSLSKAIVSGILLEVQCD